MTTDEQDCRDLERVELLVRALGGVGPIRCFVVLGQPQPWQRAGHFRGRHYTKKQTRDAESGIAWEMRTRFAQPFPGNVALAGIFYRDNRLRVDGDNLGKMILDGATKGGVWNDDCQVTGSSWLVEYDHDRPRTVLALAQHSSSMDRSIARAPKTRKAARSRPATPALF